ncbi:Serralysin B precursor [Aquisphaera giovannonii]|uniref:Serralysin B n=1 Tax=Aquisphaera giovannonii TaxID=406548 RepID=A0A5B9VYW8_9BACT|nr:hypothetical protein [Aquisphaera giovannonii]QEH33141.1 Serralysin B precursor [Aquisphaera giovannonii]
MSSRIAGRHGRPRLAAPPSRVSKDGRRTPSPSPGRNRRRPALEGLEGRTLLSITASGYDAALGAVTLTGNSAGSYLVLGEAPSPDLSGHPEVLVHNLPYSSDTPGALNSLYDFDPSTPGDQELEVGQGTAPMVTVDFSAGGANTLQLDTSWTFAHPVAMTGGAGQDTLIDSAAGSHAWTLTGAKAGQIGSNLTFAGVDAIQADSANDDSLQGQDAVSATWTFAAGSAATYGVGSPSISFQGFKLVRSGSGNNTFQFSGDGTVGSLDIQGGDGDDAFDFSDFAQLDGSIDGGDGSNTLAYYDGNSSQGYSSSISLAITSVSSTVGYDGIDSMGTSLTGTFSNITSLVGNASSDVGAQLVGSDADSTWTLAGSSAVSYKDATDAANPSLSLSGFSDLVGGAGDDTYDITADTAVNIWETAGTNTFNISDGATLDGMVGGGSGTDTLDMSAYTTALSVVLTGSDATGLAGTVGPVSGGFFGIDGLAAGSGSDQLTGEDVDSVWTLGSSSASYADGTATLAFSNFESLQGGSAVDTYKVDASTSLNLLGGGGLDEFEVADGATASGTIDGQADSGRLDLGGYTADVHITLSGSDATGFSGVGTGTVGFQGISTLIAGSGAVNTLTGEDVAATWTVNGSGSAYSDGAHSLALGTFNVFQGGSDADTFNVTGDTTATLDGGAGADAFVFSDGAVLTGSIDGSGGANTLDLGAYTTPVTVVLDAGAASGVGGTTAGATDPITGRFDGIGTLSAGGTGSSLVGQNASRVWNLDTTDTYGDGTDTFLTFSGFGALTGGSDADAFNIVSNTTANLGGGGGGDTFDFQTDGVVLTGKIDGGSGSTASLIYSGYTSAHPVTLNLATGFATGTNGVKNIGNLFGGNAATTTLTGPTSAGQWTIEGQDAGNVVYGGKTFVFSSVGNLTGGIGDDAFYLTEGGTLSGTIIGGIGSNSIQVGSLSNAVTMSITGANAGNILEGISGSQWTFSGIGNLTGTGLGDTFKFSKGASIDGAINGQGNAKLDYSAYTTSVRVDLGLGYATGVKGGLNGAVTGVANVTGGSGNDILIGNASANVLSGGPGGNDVLVGRDGDDVLTVAGSGRNILIGGNGADTLNASTATGDNLLIGGRVAFSGSETNTSALTSLMTEWSRAGVDFTTRTKHLTGQLSGGLNGQYKLVFSGAGQTVFNDAAIDSLYGSQSGPGHTWFVAFYQDSSHKANILNSRTGDRTDTSDSGVIS